MTSYWDTSAAINALVSPEVFARLKTGRHLSRLHMLAEFFSTMTERGIKIVDAAGNEQRLVLSQRDCALWLQTFSRHLFFDELDQLEALTSLDKAESLGVRGPHIYDYWHALVANNNDAEVLTRNTGDFAGLAKKVTWP